MENKELENIKSLLCSPNDEDIVLGILLMMKSGCINQIMSQHPAWSGGKDFYSRVIERPTRGSENSVLIVIIEQQLFNISNADFIGLAKYPKYQISPNYKIVYNDNSIKQYADF